MPSRKLLGISGIGEQKAIRIHKAALCLVPSGTVDLGSLSTRAHGRLVTGSAQLDSILGAGVEMGGITEVSGEARCGKTQLCHTLCITVQLPECQGGAGRKALYIDTAGAFRPERLCTIADRFGLPGGADAALENVTYVRAYNSEQLQQLLAGAAALLAGGQHGLIVVDSVTGLFRTDYVGRGELAERQLALSIYLRGLQQLADEYGCAVVVTNQVMAIPDAQPGQAQLRAAGGHVLAHASRTRLSLRKGKGEARICKLMASPDMPEAEAQFAITQGGITDLA